MDCHPRESSIDGIWEWGLVWDIVLPCQIMVVVCCRRPQEETVWEALGAESRKKIVSETVRYILMRGPLRVVGCRPPSIGALEPWLRAIRHFRRSQ
jgi:hypothetical protein